MRRVVDDDAVRERAAQAEQVLDVVALERAARLAEQAPPHHARLRGGLARAWGAPGARGSPAAAGDPHRAGSLPRAQEQGCKPPRCAPCPAGPPAQASPHADG